VAVVVNGVSKAGTTANYVYDDAGQRVAETVNGTTTLYLTDHANPTGYAQPLEEESSPTATPSTTHPLGDRVFGQADAAGNVSYLLTDGAAKRT
jgi:YD repeat-containing protein